MPIVLGMEASEPGLSSLIFTLAADPELRERALDALHLRPDLELGRLAGCWLPAALTAADPHDVFREFEAIPGIEFVEVVFVELTAPGPRA
jgi:hypothetical protein